MVNRRLPSDQDGSGRDFGDEELAFLREVLECGTLTATKGRMVKTLAEQFARVVGARHATACSSGTAAIHAAVAALNPEPGDEIVTTPITDMGALATILYQGAIPVFADVDPRTGNVTADDDCRPAQRSDEGNRGHPPVRQPVRDGPRSWLWRTGTGCRSWRTAPRPISPRPAVGPWARSARSGASAFSRASTSPPARAAWS